jgi:FkbM family methyltransferase
VLKKIGDYYALIFGHPLLNKMHRGLFYLSCRGLGLLNYSSSTLSGELYVQKNFIPLGGSPVVFDIGANKGEWSKSVLCQNPHIQLHIFEPNNTHLKKLNMLSQNATINNVAVGDKNSEMTLFDYADNFGSEHASLIDGVIDKIHNKPAQKVCVSVITLDDYCNKKHISFIDFLKIDTEGFEYQVLCGGKNMLKNTRIIQFEFNEMNIIGKIYFKDFFNLLSNNFRIFRMLPHGLVEIKNYSALYGEQFVFQNLLAINKNE